MPERLFKVGDKVQFRVGTSTSHAETFLSSIGALVPSGIFEVAAILPEEDGQQQLYRVKGGEPPHERMTRESQLIPANMRPQPRR
jgi:hypothetical protein